MNYQATNNNLSLKEIVFITIVIILSFLLQISIFSKLHIFYAKINFILLVTILLNIKYSDYKCIFINFFNGILLDLWLNTWFINTIVFILLYFLVTYFNKIYKDNLIITILITVIGVLLYEIIIGLLYIFIDTSSVIFNWKETLLFTVIINTLFGTLMSVFIKKNKF